jgi:2-phospho-L-lactate guanylyltransferase
VLLVPGDTPLLDPVELDALIARQLEPPFVLIVPDRHGTGTNGLMLSPPDAIAPSFGPGSFERHRDLALAAGLPCRVEQPSSLLLDIDTGADLATLRDRPVNDRPDGARALAPHTRAVLTAVEQGTLVPLTTSA